MFVGQRPITEAALNEASTEPAWKTVPAWFVYGDKDKNIPPQALAFMADRAKSEETNPRGAKCARSQRQPSSAY